jgi:tetratricopeptide (TPR) repeat protein
MGGLLELFGRAITFDASDLIWRWLSERQRAWADCPSLQERHLDHIIDLMGDSHLEAATEQLRLYLFEHSSCCFGRMAAAGLALCANNLPEAVEELNSVYLRQPNNTVMLYALGHCYERLGHQAQAIEFYQDCLKFKGDLQLPAQRLAAIYFKDGRLDEAIAQYEPMSRYYPDDVSTLVTLGHLYIATGQCDKAIETFNTAILIHPDNFITQDETVDQLLCAGQLDEALDHVDVLLADQPERADLLAKRADILAAMGATSDAIVQYQQAIRICPDFLEATIKLGTNYLRMHTDQLAARQFNRAVEINDKLVEAYTGLAAAQNLAGHSQDALGTLSLASAIQPNSAFLFAETAKLILKAALKADLIQTPEASQTLDDIVMAAHRAHLARFPHNPDLSYRLAILCINVDQFAEAVELLEASLRINPTFARATTKMAVCLFETGRQQQALDLIMPQRSYDPGTLELYYQTALLYCNRIKFASSVINLQQQLEATVGADLNPAANISIVLQNLGLSDTVGVMWENLCQTTAHAPVSDA